MHSSDSLIINFTYEELDHILTVTQYDTGRKVRCYVTGIVGEVSLAEVYCRKPSGLEVYTSAEIVDEHTIDFEIDQQMIAETGETSCQLQLFGTGNALTSFKFKLRVRENLVSKSRITSTDEYKALQDLLVELSGFQEISEEEIDEIVEM